jgi:hypothetical protein
MSSGVFSGHLFEVSNEQPFRHLYYHEKDTADKLSEPSK